MGRKYGGTGLGLWISKNIIQKMRGDIRVKSKLGRGSNFIVAFPVRVAEEVAAMANVNDGEVAGAEVLRDKTYLLLDDIAENTFIVAASLRRYGISSTIRQNGMDALEAYKSAPHPFDGIITDLRMPLMSGQTFIQEIRRLEHESGKSTRVPIMVMTAESATEEKRLCLTQYGATEYLLKPMKLRDLVSVLVRVHSSSENRKRPRNVLIIDDDAVGSKFLMVSLAKVGHKCAQAFSVAEGVRMLSRDQYDVVILDNLLGDGTGLDFMRTCERMLAGADGKRRTRVISVSGNDVAEQKRMYESVAVDGFLQKPVRKQDVLGLIQVL